jgi:hypothetical protein
MTMLKPDYNRILPAMIALERPELPRLEKLVAVLQEVAGLDVNLQLLKSGDEGLMVGLGDDRAAVALSLKPITWNAIEGPCATAWWWPEASEAMQHHAAHLLVVVAGEPGQNTQDRIARHQALTQFTAAVASLCRARGIYWVTGGMVHQPSSFIAEARRSAGGRLPLHLWVDMRIEPIDGPIEPSASLGCYRMFTTGMQSLGELEMEIVQTSRSIPEILDFSRAVAQHLLTTTETIEDGHTLGRSESEKVKISRATSILDEKMTVWRLEFL